MINKHTFPAILCSLLIVPVVGADETGRGEGDRRRGFDQAIVADTAVLLEKGELETTFGVSFEDENSQETVELTVEVDYGVTDWLEVGVQVPYLFLLPKPKEEKEIDGLGDVTLSISLSLLAEHPFWVSTSLDVTLDTGDGHGSNDFGAGVVQWSPSITMDLAAGNSEWVLGIGGEFGDRISVFVFEVTLAYPIDELVPSIGVEGSLDGDEKEVFLVPGVGFPIAEDVEFGIEVPIGLTSVSSDWKVGIQVTVGF